MERSVDRIDLFSPVTALKGVGPARARQLEKLGIFTLYDLIAFFPRGYEDRTKRVAIAALEPDVPACFEAMVISQPTTAYIRRGMELTRVRVADETGQLTLSWFNQSYRKNQLVYGESYIFYGAVRADHPGQMANPSFESADSAGQVTGRLVPIYPLTAGITSRVLAACIAQALDACRSELPDILPETVRQQYHLCPAPMAYEMIHRPLDAELLNEARRRLVFEEFFVFSAGLALLRSRQTRGEAEPCRTDCMSPFDVALPFRLTGAQQHAIDDILARSRLRRADESTCAGRRRQRQDDGRRRCGLLRHTKRPSGRIHGPDGDPRGAARGDALASARARSAFRSRCSPAR